MQEFAMARSKKLEREIYYFEQFRRHFPLPDGVVEYCDKPDLILRDPNSKAIRLGIEQTALYHKDGDSVTSEQKQSGLRLEVLELAEKEFKKHDDKDLRLSVCFNCENPIISTKNVAKDLFEYALKICPESHNKTIINPPIKEISSIYVQWNVGVPWQLSQVYSVPMMSKERLQSILDVKNRKATSYTICPELWLLVVIDFGNWGQDQEIDFGVESLQSDHFSKVILFKTVFNQILEIPCVKEKE